MKSNSFKRLITRLTGVALLAVVSNAAMAESTDKFTDTSRIVAVGGSVTEIIYALGAEKSLIARDQTSMYPDAANKLPDVGYMRRLAPEGVLSVNPSGILMIEGSGPKETLDVLQKASVPIITVPEKYSREGVLEKIEVVGKALGLENKAKALSETVGKDLAEAETAARKHDKPKRVLFVLSAPGGRLMVSGIGTAADAIIKLAGGVNVIDEYPGYKQLTDEAAEKAAPDVILTMGTGQPGASEEQLADNSALSLTPAGKAKNIIKMDGLYLLGFGPRTGAAIRELSEKLYRTSETK